MQGGRIDSGVYHFPRARPCSPGGQAPSHDPPNPAIRGTGAGLPFVERLRAGFSRRAGGVGRLRAVAVVNRTKDDVEALVEDLVKGQTARKWDRYERYIREHPGVSGRDLQRATSDNANDVKAIVSELQQQERIRVEWKDGRPDKCWPSGVKASDVGNVA